MVSTSWGFPWWNSLASVDTLLSLYIYTLLCIIMVSINKIQFCGGSGEVYVLPVELPSVRNIFDYVLGSCPNLVDSSATGSYCRAKLRKR
jgi:hypothetical protein